MPAGTIPVWRTPDTDTFILRIGGQVVTRSVPVGGDGGGLSFSESNESSTGQMSFTIEDPDGTQTLTFGSEVQLIDKRDGTEVVLFGGHLIEARVRKTPATVGRMFDCTAIGYDAWLDWRVVPRFTSRANVQKRINRYEHDRAMVQALIDKFGGDLRAPNATVELTNANMPNVAVVGMTLREALDAIAEAATPGSDSNTRFFYVDDDKRLHWYQGTENLTAPYNISEGVYTRDVLDTAGLIAFWRFSQRSGTTVTDLIGTANGTLVGAPVSGYTGGINNEPHLTSTRFPGINASMTASATALHPGDTFTIEIWFQRDILGTSLTTAQTVYEGQAGGIRIGFDTSSKLLIEKVGTGTHFVSTASISDDDWHHLVITRAPADTDVYLDGSVVAGTTTPQTFTTGTGAVTVAATSAATQYFRGYLSAIALYSTVLSQTTVRKRYSRGASVVPEDFELTLSAHDGREAVYIAGKNIAGSGFVRQRDWLIDTAFGKRAEWGKPDGQPERQAFIEREQSEDGEKRRAIGRAYLRRHTDPQSSGSFSITGFDGWKVGQKIRIYMPSLDIRNDPDDGLGYPFEIKDVQTTVGMGNGVMTHTIEFGQVRLRATRILSKKRRR